MTHPHPILLVAHGSADPRAGAANRALAGAIQALYAERVRGSADTDAADRVEVAFLDHAGPRPGEVLFEFAADGAASATVVPLLLTQAYHRRVDIPAVLTQARADGLALPIALADVMGPVAGIVPKALLAALRRRLIETRAQFDAVVLAAAGTRDEVARTTVEHTARALGESLGVPALAAYASASAPTGEEAVARLRADGARDVAVAAYFLAPGRLYDTVVASARAGGVTAVAEPLEDAPELARLVLERVAAARMDASPQAA